jgi:hypothetical protein
MKGHLSFRRGGLSLYIKEPDPDMMYRSMEIYEEAYDKAYGEGLYLKDELPELLYNKDLYSPFDDQRADKIKKEIEDLKVQAFKSIYKPKELNNTKYMIKKKEDDLSKIYKRKHQFDHVTCEGVAIFAQWNWIIEKSTYNTTNDAPYDWSDISVSDLMSYYESSSISSVDFRHIARYEMWRPIWALGKKTGNLFGCASSSLTRDQITLCSFSMMYDGVYESPESPSEKVIEDDDCLDGWFIEQRKKQDRMKKQQQAESLMSSNSKIANSGEVFIIADSAEEIEFIDSLNDGQSAMIKNQRMAQLKQKGEINSDLEFKDVALDMQMQQNQSMMNKASGK